jgi:hypothetical protein
LVGRGLRGIVDYQPGGYHPWSRFSVSLSGSTRSRCRLKKAALGQPHLHTADPHRRYADLPTGRPCSKTGATGADTPPHLSSLVEGAKGSQDRVDQEKDIQVLAVARVGVEPEHGINIILVNKRDIPKNLSKDLDTTIDNTLEEDIKVRVAILKGTVDDYLKEVN